MLVEFLVGVIAIMLLTSWYFQNKYNIWERRGIPAYKVHTAFKDILTNTFEWISFPEQALKQYNGIPDKSVYGIYSFNIPMLMIKDPDLLKQIMIKDFEHFTDHNDTFFKEDIDPYFSKNLFAIKGKRWHDMRTVLSPAFTGSKMRNMFILIRECGDQLTKHFKKKYNQMKDDKKLLEVEIHDASTRFTNDIISTIAFGIKIDSLENPNNEIYKIGLQTTEFKLWRLMIVATFPYIAKIFQIKLMPSWVYEYFSKVIRETLHMRERENIVRPDMIHLLTEARKGKLKYDNTPEKDAGIAINEETNVLNPSNGKIVLTEDDIIAQAFVFFFAGFANVALTMAWASYELALYPDVQTKLYDEIKQTLEENDGKLTYDVLMKMKYLDMVVAETLRKWPAVPLNNRQVTKPYTLKTEDGEIHLETGLSIAIPIMGLHWDPKYFPNPDKFEPERFSDPSKIHPFTYMPFGAGPRLCIGNRLTLLEVKVFLVHMLLEFEFVKTNKTRVPPVLKKGANVLMEGGFWVGLRPRNY